MPSNAEYRFDSFEITSVVNKHMPIHAPHITYYHTGRGRPSEYFNDVIIVLDWEKLGFHIS